MLSIRKKDGILAPTHEVAASAVNVAVGGDSKGPLGLSTLFSPPKPLVELVFVHGLGGGSRKTWKKDNLQELYWPQQWLRDEVDLQGVRIHSFGYDADWIKGTDNCLNILHISKAFLIELSILPTLLRTDLPLVLIGHSMGGLVIKKAYLLAKQNPVYQSLAERFHSVLFLATPHRGAIAANLLNNMLHLAFSTRGYVEDLERTSAVLQSINEDFRNCSSAVNVWSFYETQKMKIGLKSTLMVEPDSATLGWREERQVPMNADHRSICKFSSKTDNNYIVLRNAIINVVQSISLRGEKPKGDETHLQSQKLQEYLDAPEAPLEDLESFTETRLQGTCSWILDHQYFRSWEDGERGSPRIIYLTGPPASGKSTLASFVIERLQSTERTVCYYFFRHGEKSKSHMTTCIRSLALQMANTSEDVQKSLLGLVERGKSAVNNSVRGLWRLLFSREMLKSGFPPTYWVIDALDESMNEDGFVDCIRNIPDEVPLRIFVTSRVNPAVERSMLDSSVQEIHLLSLSPADTYADMRFLIDKKAEGLILRDEQQRQELEKTILSKSNGCFLWTSLILDELLKCHSENDMQQTLAEMPGIIKPLYARILCSMFETHSNHHLIKGILTWVTCTVRSLTISELEGALKMDMNDRFARLEDSVRMLCGELVTTDKAHKLRIIHETAREYLLDEGNDHPFSIKKVESHTRITRACLLYLSGDEMKPLRTRRSGGSARSQMEHFAAYAVLSFSHHLARSDPNNHEVNALLERFLKANVLSWIEHLASTQNLHQLVRASKDLQKYHSACLVLRSPLGKSMHLVSGWVTDLTRIAARFADALKASPSAITSTIAPFCPSQSCIQKAAGPGRRLTVAGLSALDWDDRVSCIDFHDIQTSAIAYSEDFLAIGLLSGSIILHHASHAQYYKTFHHKESVRLLAFKSGGSLLASYSAKNIRIWDIDSGSLVHNFHSQHRIINLSFTDEGLMATASQNYICTWTFGQDVKQLPYRSWRDLVDGEEIPLRGTPCAVAIGTAQKLLAIAYNQRAIILWDLEEDAFFGHCGKRMVIGEHSKMMVTAMVFSPNVDIGLLAISYLDGELISLEPLGDQELAGFRANCHTLAASPDGRFLAGGAGTGVIQIFEFDTLKTLYRVRSANFFIKQLAFAGDGLRVADIRGSHCNVWEPVALFRDVSGEGSSEATAVSLGDTVEVGGGVRISCVIADSKRGVVYCGKSDGSVTWYDLKSGKEEGRLYSHKTSVRLLALWQRSGMLTSIDASNRVSTWTMVTIGKSRLEASSCLFSIHLNDELAAAQVTIGEEPGKLIISTRETDHLLDLKGTTLATEEAEDESTNHLWAQHFSSPHHVLRIDSSSISIFDWETWSEVLSLSLAPQTIGDQLDKFFHFGTGDRTGLLIVSHVKTRTGRKSTIRALSTDALQVPSTPEDTKLQNHTTLLDANTTSDAPLLMPSINEHFEQLSQHVAGLIGFTQDSTPIFIDTRSWVCSVDTRRSKSQDGSSSYLRHFFLPYDWSAGRQSVLCALAGRDIILTRENDVVVVRGWAEIAEKVHI